MGLLKGRTIPHYGPGLKGDEWVINGHNALAHQFGRGCQAVRCACTTRPGSSDIDDFRLHLCGRPHAKGVTQGGPYEKSGMAADKNGDIWFDDVRVPVWYRAHGPGRDAEAFYQLIPFGQVASIAFLTGAMMNMYERLYEFVSTRTYRNRPLKENPAVAGIIGRIAGDIDICRILGHEGPAMMGDRGEKHALNGLPLIYLKSWWARSATSRTLFRTGLWKTLGRLWMSWAATALTVTGTLRNTGAT